jgi:hypothetical protein
VSDSHGHQDHYYSLSTRADGTRTGFQ